MIKILGIKLTNSSIESLISQNTFKIDHDGENYSGEGWNVLQTKISNFRNVLIGEDHFTNEIPNFISKLVKDSKFDNFYVEIDPYSLKIIEESFSLSETERTKFNSTYSDLFAFFAKKVEYDLLFQIYNSGANLLGSEQIVMYADKLLFDYYSNKLSEQEIINQLKLISAKSSNHLENFLKNPNENSMYMMTSQFDDDLNSLEQLNLPSNLSKVISDLRLSKKIYETRSHELRVKLMLNLLMKDYEKWNNKKNLFKFGANHMTRGESFLYVEDIGNIVANISRSQFEESFHLMIIGNTGDQSSPFRGFPNTQLDPENGFYLNFMSPFFKQIKDDNVVYLFNLLPLRDALLKEEITIKVVNLVRLIKGFDYLVIFPKVTASQHM